MFEKIIRFSLQNKPVIWVLVLGMTVAGIMSMQRIPLDAVPDITNNQVQVVTTSPTLPAEEIESQVTYPIEAAMMNIPDVEEVRSISRYGLSVVTIVFEESVDLMKARQFVAEQLIQASDNIPAELGTPSMMPITTGLGEIYQYVLVIDKKFRSDKPLYDLRTIQDWIVKRQLAGVKGIIDVSSFGGYLKEYEVAVDPLQLVSYHTTLDEVYDALHRNNSNSGGGYVDKGKWSYYIRATGRVKELKEIKEIVIKVNNDIPVRVSDVAKVNWGHANRYGAMTMDGKGEVVGGITLMLKGANSSEAITNVHDRIAQIQKMLPEGVHIYPYLDRSVLVGKTIHTVSKNLIEGGLIVILVLVLLLGNLRAGIVVASVIPLSLLFAFILMRIFHVSANLMSLGAIDFGIVIDGAVIIVEGILHYLHDEHRGKRLSNDQMDGAIAHASSQIYRSAAFGVLIILVVFIPIFALQGIEGKMFVPMAQTVSFAILGSLILSVTYVPVASALILSNKVRENEHWSDRLMNKVKSFYAPVLNRTLHHAKWVITSAFLLLLFIGWLFSTMGGEFIPTMNEGDMAMQMSVPAGCSLQESIATTTRVEALLKNKFPEVKHVVSKIGTAEIPTDPMAVEDTDVMILLRPKEEWVSASSKDALMRLMKKELSVVKNTSFEFSQPIQLRFNELMTGSKTDIAVKIFGEDPGVLHELGDKAAEIIQPIQGAADVKVERTEGLRQIHFELNRQALAIHHIDAEAVLQSVRMAYAGESAGWVYEQERRFDLVVRLDRAERANVNLDKIFLYNHYQQPIALSSLVHTHVVEGPMLITREEGKRRIAIGVNVRDRDVASLVADIEKNLNTKLKLPPGYSIRYGGQFENLQNAMSRLMLVVPIVLLLIIFLLYLAFGSARDAMVIFMAVPLSAIGGVLAMWIRGLPFSISAGIGFIALFGVAVLNGIVLVNEFKRLRMVSALSTSRIVQKSAMNRIRPVLMTALVASFGFLPMALSTGNGAEVQRPLATVVIGGLISSTLLTLLILPTLYLFMESIRIRKKRRGIQMGIALFFFIPFAAQAQLYSEKQLIERACALHPSVGYLEKEIQLRSMDQKKAYLLSPTEVNVQYGQINFAGKDYNVSVMQDLGNPFRVHSYKQMAQANTRVTEEQLKRTLADQVRQVRVLYQQWLTYQSLHLFMEKQKVVFEKAVMAAEDQQRSGNISTVDAEYVRQLLRYVQTSIAGFDFNRFSASSELKVLAQLKDQDSLATFPIRALTYQASSDSVSSIHTSSYDAAIEQLEWERKWNASGITPSFNAGYFTQSLNGERGFQGFSVGISLPLFATGRSVDQQKTELRSQQMEQLKSLERSTMESRLTTELNLITQMQKNIKSYPDDQVDLINKMLTDLEGSYRVGQLSAFEYAQRCRSLIESVVDHMQWILQLNQHIIELEYITNTYHYE